MDSYRKDWAEHPVERSGFLSQLFFTWTSKIFLQDRKRQLTTENIWAPRSKHKSEKLGDKLERIWLEQLAASKKTLKPSQPSLAKAVTIAFWNDIMIVGIMHLGVTLADVLLKPYLLGALISSFSQEVNSAEAALIASELTLVNVVYGIINSHYSNLTAILGMKMRAAAVTVVFRKSLRLSRTALNDDSSGQIVNLVSNDVSRFEIVVSFAHFLWSGPLQTFIIAYFLYRDVGLSGFAGMGVVGIVTVLQTYTAQLTSRFRRKIARETDQRIRLTDEVLAGILVLKLYAWEKPFAKLLENARRAELKYVRASNLIRSLYMAFNLSTTKFALFLTLSIYILSGFRLSTAEVFVIVSYYALLNQTISSVFIRAVQEISECRVSFRRLQEFLLREEMEIVSPTTVDRDDIFINEPGEGTPLKADEENVRLKETDENLKNNLAKGSVLEKTGIRKTNSNSHVDVVEVRDVTASWLKVQVVPTLMNVTFSIDRGNIAGLIGSVGAGKSSLLHLIMGELAPDTGRVTVDGTISYASQEPWIFAGTVRDNILLGLPYDRARYRKIISASCLTRDMELFPHGDRTMVGERGASLSGGQRARINLARAIYREADIYLLDDPLSAVDAHVAKEMFQNCFKGFLRNKTVILATHQLQFLDQVDKVILLQAGQIKDMGKFEHLLKRGYDFTKIMEESPHAFNHVESADDFLPEEEYHRRHNSESEPIISVKGSSVDLYHSLGSNVSIDCKEKDETQAKQESNTPYDGNIISEYVKSGNAVWTFSAFLLTLLLAQSFASLSDYWVSNWAKTFDIGNSNGNMNFTTIMPHISTTRVNTTERQNAEIRNILEHTTESITFETANTTSIILHDTSPNFLQNLTSQNGFMGSFKIEWTDEFYVIVYGIMVGSMFTIALLRGFLFVLSTQKCSEGLHSQMINSALHTDMSFFNNNPSGQILNKFSKDLGATDEMLPKSMLDSCQAISMVVGAIANILIVNYLLLIPLSVFILASILFRNYYIYTSTNLKRNENISRGPVYTHLNTCLQGLTTIRAQSAQTYLKKAFDSHQDLNTSCLFTYLSTQQAYFFCLDMCSNAYVALLLFSCIWFKGDITGAELGLAVTQSMTMILMLQWAMRQSTEVVNMMTSVERLVTFTKLPLEDPYKEKVKPPQDWPTNGAIQLESVSLRYIPDGPPALNAINLDIRPGEKLGIVGRTGAGKSTLTSVLFRLAPVEGKCIIDGFETSTLDLQALRSSLAIIPQNPVLFSGNLRMNLDPFQKKPDHELWNALEDIDMNEIAKDGKGLDSRISDCGSNLSVGQRQLVCLARAVLKNRNIIVLDEATASVEPETDAQIQKTIRKRFSHCTVLTIAHRLNTIMDSDRILVMEAGRAVELDTPHNLLLNKDGYFYSLVHETGTQMATRLTAQAQQNHIQSFEDKKN